MLSACFSAHDSEAGYCDERLSVCLCVCLRVFVCPRPYLRNYTSNFHKIVVHVTNSRGSVLLWRRTSGFVDDVIFAHNPRLLDVAAQLKRSVHAALGLAIHCAQSYEFQANGRTGLLFERLK